jgi:hypothetical protein
MVRSYGYVPSSCLTAKASRSSKRALRISCGWTSEARHVAAICSRKFHTNPSKRCCKIRTVSRSPDLVRLCVAVECPAEEGIEAADMVHMEVREEEVIDREDFSNRQLRKTPLAAIE